MQPGRAPPVELPLERMPPPERANRSTEKGPDLAPAVCEYPPCEGKHGSDVDIPEWPSRASRDAELERREGSAGKEDTRELSDGCARVVDVAKEIRERDVVERFALERQVLGRGLDERHATRESTPRHCDHLRALVDTGHAKAALQQSGRDQPGSRSNIEDVTAVLRQPRDEEATPQRILPEGESRADSVVRRSERSEERACVILAIPSRHGCWHGFYSRVVAALADELERIAALAAGHARAGDIVSAVIPTESFPGKRVCLCAFDDADGYRSWLALDGDGRAVTGRRELRDAVTVAVLCEIATDAAGGGDLDDLITRLRELRETEAPPGIEDAEEAALALRGVVGEPPQLATPARLDEIGAAARRLEQELDPGSGSPFAAAMRSSEGAVAELQREIEGGYRVPLD